MSSGSASSLQHLMAPAKLVVMRPIRRVVGDWGLFLIYENACPDGEGRDGWLRRWDDQRPTWTEFTPEEWEAGRAHEGDPMTAQHRRVEMHAFGPSDPFSWPSR